MSTRSIFSVYFSLPGIISVISAHYQKINQTTTDDISETINEIVCKLLANKEIDKQTFLFLTDDDDSQHGELYLLPKIHKIDPKIIKDVINQGD